MLFWPKLLTVAHAVASSVRPFLPLYLSHLLGFSCLDITILMAVPLLLRSVSLGFWTIVVVDPRSLLHGFFMALLTAVGTAALVLILWIPPHAPYAWYAALFCMVLDGLFYQPLGVLIDSAIIKILGDYKMLYYDAQRQWGQLAAAVMAVGIGWSLDDDHDFDTLMGTVLTGSMLLFLLSLSTTVQPADPSLLGIPAPDDEEASTLLKDSIEPTVTTDSTADFCHTPNEDTLSDLQRPIYKNYKPYCLFNEQLSHISEEDASMIQRMASTTNLSTRFHQQQQQQHAQQPNTGNPPRPTSLAGSESLFSQIAGLPPRPPSCHSSSAGSNTGTATGDVFQHSSSQYWATTASTTANNILEEEEGLFAAMPSLQLALLPSPPPDAPMLVLWPQYHKIFPVDEARECVHSVAPPQRAVWCLVITLFVLGMAGAMMNALLYIFLHDSLGIPMHMVGIVGMVTIASEVAARNSVSWLAHRFHLIGVVGSAHITLIVCALTYTWLQPGHLAAHALAVILQLMQALAFQILWLLAIRQVDAVLLTADQYHRMFLRGKMSVLFNSIGPALGSVLAGLLVDSCQAEIVLGFTLLFRCTAALLVLSALISWPWCFSVTEY